MSGTDRTDPTESMVLVDPDPFVVASFAIACTATILQLVQTYKAFRPSAAPPMPRSIQRQSMTGLETSADSVLRDLRRITRAVEQGSPNSDVQFYDAQLRVSKTMLELPQAEAGEYSQATQSLSGNIGGLSSWINNMIANDPALAARLGERIGQPLSGTAEALNVALANGGSTRQAIVECRSTLKVLAAALEEELDSGNAG